MHKKSGIVYFINEYQRIALLLYEEDFDEGGDICIMILSGDEPPPSIKRQKSTSQSSPNFYLLGSVRSI